MKIDERDGALVVVDFDEREAYQIACRIEKDGIRLYQDLAGQEKDPEARKMLDFLIADERSHLQFFEQQLHAAEAKTERDAENDVLESLDYGVFYPYDRMTQRADVLPNSKAALKLAVKIEDNSLQFYQACRRHVSSDSTKQQLQRIIDEEQRHREVLQSLLASLS